jgi:phospholipase/carboxylesterase
MDESKEIEGWVVRERVPSTDGPHPLTIMLHGWTGNENSMWVFSSKIPQDVHLISIRGLFPAAKDGFSWYPSRSQSWPTIEDFLESVDRLNKILTPRIFPTVDLTNIRLVGFSQGAAFAFTFALLQPQKITALAGLSGFVPDGFKYHMNNKPLQDIPIFVAHGSLDKMVPVEKAREAVNLLRLAGAQVYYCEVGVGHKLSSACFRDLGAFFRRF